MFFHARKKEKFKRKPNEPLPKNPNLSTTTRAEARRSVKMGKSKKEQPQQQTKKSEKYN